MGIERNLAFAPEAEWSHVVKPKNMVGMSVRIKDGVKPFDVLAKRLLTEIRRSIDEDRVAVELYQNRRTGAPVMRIVGRAYAAVAPNGGNAHRRSAAQHRESRLHFLSTGGIAPGGIAPGGIAPGLVAEVATALVISMKAIRSSNITFCSSVFSRSV